MAYFGKEFKFDKEDNFEEFIKSLATQDNSASKFLTYKPNYKLVKNGDEYTLSLSTGDFNKDITFKPGVSFQETLGNGLTATSTFTVDGDTLTQVQDFGDKGIITYKREFSPDQLVVTVSTSKWDGVAYRYYVA